MKIIPSGGGAGQTTEAQEAVQNAALEAIPEGASAENPCVTADYKGVLLHFDTVVEAEAATGIADNRLVYVVELNNYFRCETSGAAYTRDGMFVLNTGDGGDTRLIAEAGVLQHGTKHLSDGLLIGTTTDLDSGEAFRVTGVDRGDSTYYLTTMDKNLPGLKTNGYITINGASGDPIPVAISGESAYMLGIRSDLGAGPCVVIRTQSGPVFKTYTSSDELLMELDADGAFSLQCNTDGSTGVVETTVHSRAGGAGIANDVIWQHSIKGYNNAVTPELIEYARIKAELVDPTDGSEDGMVDFGLCIGGTLYESQLTLMSDGVHLSIITQSAAQQNLLYYTKCTQHSVAASTYPAIYGYSNVTGSTQPVLYAHQDHASNTGPLIKGVHDGSGDLLQLYQAGNLRFTVDTNGHATVAGNFGCNGVSAAGLQTYISDPSGGGTQDAEARSAINYILDILETFGLMATS